MQPRLRSWSEPLGCARIISDGLPGQKVLIIEGNHLLHCSVMYIAYVLKVGWYFSLENPVGGLLWWQDSVRGFMRSKGVICTHLRTRAYGALRVTPTCVMHNLPALYLLHRKMEPDLPVIPIRGEIWFQGALHFLTSLASEYLPTLGLAMGHLLRVALGMAHVAEDVGLDRGYGSEALMRAICY